MDLSQIIDKARERRLIPFSLHERKQWLAERLRGIGGSDAPVVAGLSKWRTPLELWHQKRGLAGDTMTEHQLWGLLKEKLIGQYYGISRGVELFRPPEFLRSVGDHWRYANLDWCAPDRIVECKGYMYAEGFGKPGTPEVPEDIYVQCQHQMDCAGVDLCDVACLFGGNRFAVYTIPEDRELQRQMADGQHEFWQMVKSGRKPAADFSHPTTLAFVERVNRPIVGEQLVLEDGDLIELCVWEYEKQKAVVNEALKAAEQAKARIIDRMGPAAEMLLTDGRVLGRLSKGGKPLFKIYDAEEEDHG